ncbi:MAG: DUF1801 domain-containing protein [Candidatus Eisenbacteria bacterium]|nr:DUF1801 domain-containing protein [Candidatus Eisenbacteria bacterium]
MAKYEPRTKPTDVSPARFIDAIEDETLRKDSRAIVALMKSVTGESPKMWGPTIVGFGTYHYKYASGHEGDAPIAGFSPRRPKLVVYITPDFPRYEALMAKLGKYTSGKVCVYIKSLKDIDMKVLEEMVTGSVAYMKKMYPPSGR